MTPLFALFGILVCARLQVSYSDLPWVSALPQSQKNWLQYKHAYWTTSLYTVPRYIYTFQAYKMLNCHEKLPEALALV